MLCVSQNDEVSLQRKVRTEVIQLEDTLAQVRKEYEMLRIEFEQTLAANEQAGNTHFYAPRFGVTFNWHAVLQHSQCVYLRFSNFPSPQGPINREMRHLISTLQTHNQQMKGEVVKFKLRLREAQQELNQVRETCRQYSVSSHIYHTRISIHLT